MRTYSKVVATTNITKSGTQAIDGVTLAVNDRVLLTGQTAINPAGSDNGLWDVQSGAWTRSTDADTGAELYGLSVFVTQGTSMDSTAWQCTNNIPIAVGTDAIRFEQIPSVAEIPSCIDQLCRNFLDIPLNLTDGNVTLTVAGGHRYILPDNVLTQNRIITLSNTGATAGDAISIRSDQRGSTSISAHHTLTVKDAGGSAILSIMGRGEYVAEFDGSQWRGATAAGLQVFNVKDYGAIGDERVTVYGLFQQESQAIQAAIDAAAKAARDPSRDGAVVYFPPGRYRIDGYPLILRRTLYNQPLLYLGAGARASTIMNATGIGPAGDCFRAESIAENPDVLHGGEQHTFQDLALLARHYALIWDHGDSIVPGTHDGVRIAPRFLRCFFSRISTPGPAVRLRIPSRARFVDCVFDPRCISPGVIGLEIARGSGAMISCRGGGALVRFRDAGEVSVIASRCEGAQAIPGWDFYNVTNLHLANLSNECNDEADAIFRMTDCVQVTADNLAMGPTTRSYVTLTAQKTIQPTASIQPTLTFGHVDAWGSYVAENTITRDRGSWFEDLIGYGSKIRITNAALNAAWYTVIEATHDRLWVAETLVEETRDHATGVATFAVGIFDPSQLPDITFSAAGRTITRANGSWMVDGFTPGMQISTKTPGNGAVDPFMVVSISADGLTMSCASGIVDEGPLKARVEGNKFPAGVTIRKCWGFHIRNARSVGRHADLGDKSRYGIEVDANCRDGVVENGHPGASSDIYIHPSAYNVVGQSHGHSASAAVRKTWWHGRQRAVGLDIEEGLLHLRKEQTAAPTGLAGLSVRIDANGFRGIWWQQPSSRWFFAESADEAALGNYSDVSAKRYGGPANDNCTFVSASTSNFNGFAWAWSPSGFGSEAGAWLIRNGTSSFSLGTIRTLRITPTTGGVEIEPAAHISLVAPASSFIQLAQLSTGVLLYGDSKGLALHKVVPLSNPATGTGIVTVDNGRVRRATHKRTLSYQAFVAAALTTGVRFDQLPAKTRVVHVVADTTAPFQGTNITGVTARVGTEDDDDVYILSHDVWSAAATKGLDDADLGAGLARASAVQGGHIPSWTAAKELRVQLGSTGAPLDQLTQGSITVIVTVEYLG